MNQIDVDIEQTTNEISANIETQTGTRWGSITGNIESQTDLQNELDTKFNKSGGDIDGVTKITAVSTGSHSTTSVLRLGARLEGQTESNNYVNILMAPSSSSLYIYNTIFVSSLVSTSSTSSSLGTSLYQWNSAYIKNLKVWNSGTTYSIIVPTQNGTMVVATPPEDDDTYVLKSFIEDGVRVVRWLKES